MQLWINMNKCDNELNASGFTNKGIKGCGNVLYRATGSYMAYMRPRKNGSRFKKIPFLDVLYASHIILLANQLSWAINYSLTAGVDGRKDFAFSLSLSLLYRFVVL